MTTPTTDPAVEAARARLERAIALAVPEWTTGQDLRTLLADRATQAQALADLQRDKSNLIATHAEELALIGLARDSEKVEAAQALADALGEVERLRRVLTEAVDQMVDLVGARWSEVECSPEEYVAEYRAALAYKAHTDTGEQSQ